MPPQSDGENIFRFADPRQKRIVRRLALISPGPEAFYRDACRLMEGAAQIDSTPHVVAHLLREIESAIRAVLVPHDFVPPEECEQCGNRQEGHKRQIEAILRAYDVGDTDIVAVGWRKLAGRDDEMGLARFAHRDALGQPRRADETFRKLWDQVQTIFDLILEKFETRFLQSFCVIDELVAKTAPTAADARTLRNRVPHNLFTLGYFFSKAQSSAWLEPLAAEGFFRNPPEPSRDDEDGAVRVSPWPESQYLARMAAHPDVQRRVVEITLAIPETQNPSVYEDLVDIALAVPPGLAARFVPKAVAWLESSYQRFLADKLGALVSGLARGGEVDSALDLARALLKVLPDPRQGREELVLPEPQARFDLWVYGELLRKHVPGLVDRAGVPGLELLCETLASVLVMSRSRRSGRGYQDYSYVWRPAIEEHEQNRERYADLKDALVTAVRDAAEQLARNDLGLVPRLVEVLEAHQWVVFRRVALHLLRFFPEAGRSLIAQRLTDRTLFDESGVWHEYVLLARQELPRLAPDDRQTILGWIDGGPDVERLASWRERETGQRPSEDELARYRKVWQLERLAALHDGLPPDWRGWHDALAAELGEPEHPDFRSYSSGGWVGPTSPKSADELRTMSVEEIVGFLTTWGPARGLMVLSLEGVGRELTSVAASDPVRFATEANRFRGVDPTYVRALLFGLREAVGKERAFPWAPVLDLCQWVVDQDPDAREREGAASAGEDRDPGCGWTRKAIADLFEVGFQEGPVTIPFDRRDQAWRVLRPLTDDSEPTPEYEAQYGGSNMNPSELSINTTRGEAMHAVIRYALWRRRALALGPEGEARAAQGFDEMSEVREVLEAHLDPAREPSLAVRAVYGWWLPFLVLLDRQWVVDHLAQILPDDERLRELRDAAWDTYITFSRPYNNVLEVMREEYRKAANRLGASVAGRRGVADPEDRLAEHLMAFYWLGKLELNGSELTTFYARASDPVRANAISFVGRVFSREKKPVPPEILERLRALWASRLEIGRRDPAACAKELETFGWWFASGKFEDAWSLAQVVEVLTLTRKTEPDHLVMERLATLLTTAPGEVVRCVRLMIEGAREVWTIYGWRDELRAILTNATRSGDPAAREAAIAVVNVLAARGHLEFRDIASDS